MKVKSSNSYEQEKIRFLIDKLHKKNIYFDEKRRELNSLTYNELKALLVKVEILDL